MQAKTKILAALLLASSSAYAAYHCPGTYLKVPMVTDGYDEYSQNTDSTHHHHLWHRDD